MKWFTAIYHTKFRLGVQYSFRAVNEIEAIDIARRKFSVFYNLAIIENDDSDSATCGRLIFLNGHPIKG